MRTPRRFKRIPQRARTRVWPFGHVAFSPTPVVPETHRGLLAGIKTRNLVAVAPPMVRFFPEFPGGARSAKGGYARSSGVPWAPIAKVPCHRSVVWCGTGEAQAGMAMQWACA